MRIIVGITGGIAAYKSPAVIRAFTELGHDVRVLPTQNALRFIGATTLEAISHNAIDPDLFTDVESVKHIALAQDVDLIVVAPATASFIARYAAGIADDLLMNVLLATKARVVLAPAMHTEMWEHPATKQNIETLRNRGVAIVEPGVGRLTGTDSGVGRLAETDDIVSQSLGLPTNDLEGSSFLVVVGGTREPIDSVRFIGNRSSGKQGIALAKEIQNRSGKVSLVAINLEQDLSSFTEVHVAHTALEVEKLVNEIAVNFNAVLMPAAIGDFRVEEVNQGKLHRSTQSELDLHLVANPDILASLAHLLGPNRTTVLVGFAAHAAAYEATTLEEAAVKKLTSKNIDVVVANDVSNGAVFDAEDNSVLIVSNHEQLAVSGTKAAVASAVIDFIKPMLKSQ
ncbi:MAG: bifunctional phosphopantothenoylcysteine decarboxylase/phosphopantothenate--cysteine ligase CoaBC [Micrococcales bacterium]|nr:bifunctional phosphopantothenoylcysteine decarboxylase/phosphopantothenate--cysteine ligase CoaBC [Microbacteriaceae bacterium]NBR22622.1 bifunctional phosphopantothenoylcysteine decarboxylase/phosphopantothenate--cysteine ligase CoaBC [Micrococcales bacterium]NBX94153.1 bifunctional phosphopantothenoylcysteine decarboxylase/phosphopantothenate--cysteine ligase CoaBC [Actinomycetota bacterium]NBR77391.1 bifunctional phosphopantothenoylcysteine decarboxylase/phosphopantothenate--cysteine ligas